MPVTRELAQLQVDKRNHLTRIGWGLGLAGLSGYEAFKQKGFNRLAAVAGVTVGLVVASGSAVARLGTEKIIESTKRQGEIS